MLAIPLFIPDSALRDAVAEQIALTALGVASECRDWDAVCAAAESGARVTLAESLAMPDPALRGRLEAARCAMLVLGDIPADSDWITESFPRPIRLGHVMARLRYYLEAAPKLQTVTISIGPWRLESLARQIVRVSSGETVKLTEKECALLSFLAQCEAPASREDLLASIWGYDSRIDTHTLETHIYQLRRKLAIDGDGESFLVNEQGGYALKREGR